MIMNKYIRILISVSVILWGACNKRPKGVLSDNEMVGLIADMEVAEIYMQNHNSGYYNDSIRDSAVQWALEKHGLSKADFDSTMTWYGRNIDDYANLYAKVDQELALRQSKAIGKTEQDLNSTDLWPYSRHLFVSDRSNSNGVTFSIPINELQKGDKITWKMRMKGLTEGNLMLGVDYDNGASSYTYQTQNGSSKVEMTLQTDTAFIVKRIFGYVRAKDKQSLPLWLDSIALQRTPIDSTQYYRIYSQKRYPGLHNRLKSSEKNDSLAEDSKIGEILTEDNNTLSIPNERPVANKRRHLKSFDSKELKKPVKTLPKEPLKAVPTELTPAKNL